MNTIGERIAMLRIKNEYSQVGLSKKIQVSRVTLTKWENGYSTPDASSIGKLAEILNTSCDYIIRGIEHENQIAVNELGLSNASVDIMHRLQDKNEQETVWLINKFIEYWNYTVIISHAIKKAAELAYKEQEQAHEDIQLSALYDVEEWLDYADSFVTKEQGYAAYFEEMAYGYCRTLLERILDDRIEEE